MFKMFNCQLQDDPEWSSEHGDPVLWYVIITVAIVVIITIVIGLFVI